jgi:hypothetical protein
MNYDKLISTVSEIIENANIDKNGLSLEYSLNETDHKKMQEHFFYMNNFKSEPVIYTDLFEVEIGGLLIKFNKKK